MLRLVFVLLALVVAVGCRNETADKNFGQNEVAADEVGASESPSLTPTPTLPPTLTSTPTRIPSPTSTPTPTFTPTPTAIPLTVSGDPRGSILNPPTPQGNAPCGIVDTLDFPINPPDAQNVARGGQDFAVFRNRYDGYHAGEDWWTSRGRSSFGAPVYSIGHGLVTYAQPLGWGRDQGVIIIRHTFSDGDTILSFYGHLDPDSVILRSGSCVTRGVQIGRIGRPSSTPHLHFEIRSHMPYETGGGYWSEDPSLAGWKPPSKFIWSHRIAASPGIVWARQPANEDPEGIGIFNESVLVAVENDRLIGIDVNDGSLLWNHSELDRIDDASLDAKEPIIYTTNQFGRLSAYAFIPPESSSEQYNDLGEEPLWTVDHDVVGFPTLMPLPDGGVVLFVRDQLIAVSAGGRQLWELESITRPYDWAQTDDGLVFATMGRERSLWIIDGSELESWGESLSGNLASNGESAYLYAENGVNKLDTQNRSVELIYELPHGTLSMGDITVLPGGDVLVAHADSYDRRLIYLEPDGSVRWERSYKDRVDGAVDLISLGDRTFVVSNDTEGSLSTISIYEIDLESAELTRIFSGGTRSLAQHVTKTFASGDDLILIDIGGGSLAALDPELAAELVNSAAD